MSGVVGIGVHHSDHAWLDLMTVLQDEKLRRFGEKTVDLITVLA